MTKPEDELFTEEENEFHEHVEGEDRASAVGGDKPTLTDFAEYLQKANGGKPLRFVDQQYLAPLYGTAGLPEIKFTKGRATEKSTTLACREIDPKHVERLMDARIAGLTRAGRQCSKDQNTRARMQFDALYVPPNYSSALPAEDPDPMRPSYMEPFTGKIGQYNYTKRHLSNTAGDGYDYFGARYAGK